MFASRHLRVLKAQESKKYDNSIVLMIILLPFLEEKLDVLAMDLDVLAFWGEAEIEGLSEGHVLDNSAFLDGVLAVEY